MDDNQIVSLPEARLRRAFVPAPITDEPRPKDEVCPTCKFPIADVSHGWVKEYRPHEHSEKCLQRSGFCLIPCPMCSGGVTAKRQAQLVNDLFGDAHIPFYAKDWTFGSFPAVGDHGALDEVKEFVRISLDGFAVKRGLYLVGANGLGKTSMAVSALQYVIRKGHAGVFLTTVELFDLAKAAIAASRRIQDGDAEYQDRYDASKGAKLLRLVKSVEWLVLDDLGVECGSKYEIRELYLILEARRSMGLYTIFTSNRDAKDLSQYWRHAKDGVYEDGKRVIDRLGEYCFVVPVRGSNQRMQAH